MSIAWKPWLPDTAAGAAAVERRFAEIVENWSAHWFARQILLPADPAASPAVEPEGLRLLRSEEGLTLGTDAAARRTIALLMLDAPAAQDAGTEDDGRLLERLANSVLDDLCGRLSVGSGTPATATRWLEADEASPQEDGAAFMAFASTPRHPLVRLSVPRSIAATLARQKQSSSTGTASLAPLAPLADALRRQPVRLSAHLGSCRVTLADLVGLEPGDVLVLDTPLAEPVPLVLDGGSRAGSCSVQQENDRLQLRVVAPPGGTNSK